MKKLLFLFCSGVTLFMLFHGCTRACDDRLICVTLINESEDSIYCSMGYGDLSDDKRWPSSSYHFETLAPSESKSIPEYLKSELEYFGFAAFVVRASKVNRLSLERVLNSRAYDTIYSYSYEDLNNMDFTIKVRTRDLNRNNQ